MFIRHALATHAAKVESPNSECVWLQLRSDPPLNIIACYIPPADSPYHSFAPLAEIQEKIKTLPHEHFIVIGDMNSRFGDGRQLFLHGRGLPAESRYKPSADPISAPNSNARHVASSLTPLVLLNGLEITGKKFGGDLTYRQRNRWISEVDICLASPMMLPSITHFETHQRLDLPSDHAALGVSVEVAECQGPGHSLADALDRGRSLGRADVERITHQRRRAIRMQDVDPERAKNLLQHYPPPATTRDLDSIIGEVNDILYTQANAAKRETPHDQFAQPNTAQQRWQRLLEGNDHKELWKAIGWNGEISDGRQRERPSDEAFKQHFEKLLNPTVTPWSTDQQNATHVYLPVTDDPIRVEEVISALQTLKASKSGGPSGVPPGLLRALPDTWIAFITELFKHLLQTTAYPTAWSVARLTILFKKGNRSLCDNYRGIAVMDSLAKVYDAILNKRLSLWFTPDREQAGAQKGRGCTEHLITLRLLIDTAHAKHRKLYIIFVDFSKAYDRVPRDLLLMKMKDLGCGSQMASAITAVYRSTKMLLQSTEITSAIGVRQGSPTSCLLFTLLVNDLIRDLKNGSPPDDLLGWLHCLVMMDDTVIFATSRKSALHKVQILQEFCRKSGMVINSGKTQFMVIQGTAEDRTPLKNYDLTIENTDSYMYLGSTFTQDGRLLSSVKKQCNVKMPNVIKFEAFVKKNNDAPFTVKKKVFEAALMSTILYGCESWLGASSITAALPLYNGCIRQLLGVRKTTANDLCLVEAGLPTLHSRVKAAQKAWFAKRQDRMEMADDPLAHAMRIAAEGRTPAAQYIASLEEFDAAEEEAQLHGKIRASQRTKYLTYSTVMNPEMTFHAMYTDIDVKEHHRVTVTRFRLSSHNLAIERGRWTRLPREQRLCQCGAVQDEQHLVQSCPATNHIRERHPDIRYELPDFFDSVSPPMMTSLLNEMSKDFM